MSSAPSAAAAAVAAEPAAVAEYAAESPAPPATPPPPADDDTKSPEETKSHAAATTDSQPLPITVLMQSGWRSNIVIDAEYLGRHEVKSPVNGKEDLTDPMEMSVWQLKECIWNDWREDMDARPSSALFIKLIQFGGLLEDSKLLKECRFNQQGPNVVHMAIRPAEIGDDDGTQRSAKGVFGRGDREGSTSGSGARRTPSCRCVIL